MVRSAGRVCRTNGLLLAAYFVPAWLLAARRIADAPLQGIYERANLAPSLFVSDYMMLSLTGMLRFAWVMVAVKCVVAAFFALSAMLQLRAILIGKGDGEEALALALILGSLVSFASMIMAVQIAEPLSVRLHATESLMLLGGLVLLAVDSRNYGIEAQSAAPAATAAGAYGAVGRA